MPAHADLIEGYLRSLAAEGRSAKTVELRRYQLERLMATLGGDPRTVTRDDLDAWLADEGEDWSRATRRSFIHALRGFFGWLRGGGSPAAGLRPPAATPPCPKPCPDEVLAAAAASASGADRLLLRLAINTGMRRAELAACHSGDVEESGGHWWVRIRGKGAKVRRVPVPEDLARELLARDGWVFPGRGGGHVEGWWVADHLTRVLGGYSPHTVRHAYATTVYRRSRNLRAVQQLLGHASLATTERYLATNDDELAAAAATVWLS